ncbi:hypothetical protein C1Y63_06135 [Corynebacterium sp. 13CS0277]|uniref:recombinase family protein n=1 Tax=Corynebacterium sp. 13CS0277 TaxID=2071994 RepID=UPI000D0363A7|nr:recombinase family protein [Corynebacterium sp. 13CS0277]PRQ11426.1 hypothetical protein C1Y63_06135 [Corynebacterium sp. 13CS0277]
MLIGYARCSTAHQDVQVQMERLKELGVDDDQILVDHGYSATSRARPGLERALERLRAGDVLVVTKLDRLARSVADAHAIAGEVHDKEAALQIGGSIYDPRDPVGKLLFSVLAMVAEFERDLISMRTREGLARAAKAGKLRGKQPKLTDMQHRQVARWIEEGELTQAEMAAILGVSTSTISRTRKRLETTGVLYSTERSD